MAQHLAAPFFICLAMYIFDYDIFSSDFFVRLFFLGAGGSGFVASMLAFNAAIRSITFVFTAAGALTISTLSPAIFCSMSSDKAARYSSLYFVGSNFSLSCSMSVLAISNSLLFTEVA